jgi:hypothetical protein
MIATVQALLARGAVVVLWFLLVAAVLREDQWTHAHRVTHTKLHGHVYPSLRAMEAQARAIASMVWDRLAEWRTSHA